MKAGSPDTRGRMPICFGEDGLWMVNNKGITTTIAYTNIVRDALQCNALVKTCLKSLLKKSRLLQMHVNFALILIPAVVC